MSMETIFSKVYHSRVHTNLLYLLGAHNMSDMYVYVCVKQRRQRQGEYNVMSYIC